MKTLFQNKKAKRKEEFFNKFSVNVESNSPLFTKAANIIAESLKKGQSITLKVGEKDTTFSLGLNNKLEINSK